MLCDSAESNGFECVDVYHALQRRRRLRALGRPARGRLHARSQQGNDEIARLLTERGFASLG